jgi:hypothetical protein
MTINIWICHDVRFWPIADMLKNALDVAIGGKADMGWCTACDLDSAAIQ